MPRKRIFVVDDEPDMIAAVTLLLEANGYAVTSSTNPTEALERLRAAPPDLALLDVRMPEMDGFDVCRAMKAEPALRHVPVILLSVHAQVPNVVLGLELGADDYVRKPFRKQELLARVKAALRRTQTEPSQSYLAIGPLRIDFDTFSATVDGKSLPLEPKEFQLLALFARRAGRVLTRAVISEEVWGTEYLPSSRTIDVRVTELRKKLGDRGSWIQGLRGIGYRFDVEE